jgi:hypothetical protein
MHRAWIAAADLDADYLAFAPADASSGFATRRRRPPDV